MRVRFYTKHACPLCEEARDLLDEVPDLEVEEIDIYSQAELFERYRYRVPVISVDGQDVLELKFSLEDLLAKLKAP